MPALDHMTYLNTGAAGPSPRNVVAAVESCVERHECDAPAAERMYRYTFDVLDDTRETVADHLGARVTETVGWLATPNWSKESTTLVLTDTDRRNSILPDRSTDE